MSHQILPCTRFIRSLSACKLSRECFHTGIPIQQRSVGTTDFKKVTNSSEHKIHEQHASSMNRKYITPETSIVFDKNYDKFGTLSSDRMMRQIVEPGDGDDEDVCEINYIDGIEGKTRLKPINYAMMIKHHLNQNKLADALSVLENTMLKEHKAKPDMYIYNLLISGCARHGYTKKAFQLFNQMKKRSIHPKLSTYTSLFNACANGPWDHDALERAKHLRELMLEKGIHPNVVNYNAMIKAFGRHGDLETSFSIMDEMVSKKMAIDSSTFNFLLQAALSDKEAGFRHSLLVWRKMMEKKILPNSFTFNLLLRSARDCGIGDAASAQELISLLTPSEQKYITDNETTNKNEVELLEAPNLLLPAPQYGSLLSITSKLDKPWHRLVLLGSIQGILAVMDECQAKPNIKSFSLLLDILPNSDEAEKTLLNEMKQRKIKPDIDFLNFLIKKRNSSSRFQSALDVMNLMREERLVPNIMTYGVLALGCNTFAEVKELIQNIDSVGYRPNVQILTTFLSRARVTLDIDIVLFTIHTLSSEWVVPDPIFYHNLEKFRDAVLLNYDLKENGKKYTENIDTEGYDRKVSKLLTSMEDLKSKIKDPSAIGVDQEPAGAAIEIDESDNEEDIDKPEPLDEMLSQQQDKKNQDPQKDVKFNCG